MVQKWAHLFGTPGHPPFCFFFSSPSLSVLVSLLSLTPSVFVTQRYVCLQPHEPSCDTLQAPVRDRKFLHTRKTDARGRSGGGTLGCNRHEANRPKLGSPLPSFLLRTPPRRFGVRRARWIQRSGVSRFDRWIEALRTRVLANVSLGIASPDALDERWRDGTIWQKWKS